jgi:AmpE protein
MTLLVIWSALIVDRLLSALQPLRAFDWFLAGSDWLQTRAAPWLRNGWPGLLLLLAPTLAVVALLDWLSARLFLAPGEWLFGCAVLWWSLGPDDLYRQIAAVVSAYRRGDEPAWRRAAAAFLGAGDGRAEPQVSRALAQRLAMAMFHGQFAVLCWFLLAGPAGAMAYRLSDLAARHPASQAAGARSVFLIWRETLDWLPARLAALFFALAGDLGGGVRAWRGASARWSVELLETVAAGALDLPARCRAWRPEQGPALVTAAMALAVRSLFFFLLASSLVYLLASW